MLPRGLRLRARRLTQKSLSSFKSIRCSLLKRNVSANLLGNAGLLMLFILCWNRSAFNLLQEPEQITATLSFGAAFVCSRRARGHVISLGLCFRAQSSVHA